MMHQKALLFHDDAIAAQVLKTKNSKEQKALGQKVHNFQEDLWLANRERIVHDGNLAKFSQNDDLKQVLFATAGTTLVEASPYDKIWGVGLKESDPKIHNRENWNGLNLLGQAITQVRDELMAQVSSG